MSSVRPCYAWFLLLCVQCVQYSPTPVMSRLHAVECPNQCSGRGTCVSMRQLGRLYAAGGIVSTVIAGEYAAAFSYGNFEATFMHACVCEPGYYAPDCSLRTLPSHCCRMLRYCTTLRSRHHSCVAEMCPRGDDPETVAQHDFAFTVGAFWQQISGVIWAKAAVVWPRCVCCTVDSGGNNPWRDNLRELLRVLDGPSVYRIAAWRSPLL